MELDRLNNIIDQFAIDGTAAGATPFGKGLINDSYKVTTLEKGKPEYMLQRINHLIFQNVDLLMNNIITVSKHIRQHYIQYGGTDPERHGLTFIPLKTDSNKYYTRDDQGQYWRMMLFIADSVTKSEVTPENAYKVGVSFGTFEKVLADIPVPLGETIPNFHNMEFRLKQLQEAVEKDAANRLSETSDLVNDILKDAVDMCKGEQLYREGLLPKRICHCDTKVDNLLFDKNDNVLCVIDFDTVMPNFVFSDIGDFLRSAANTSCEDEPDLDKVNFNLSIFHSFIQGYLEKASAFLLPIEIENIPYATQLFPYMQAVRFLTDYLNGDTYYKISYPEHNLVRTRAQFKLYQSVKAHSVHMDAFIKECLTSHKE